MAGIDLDLQHKKRIGIIGGNSPDITSLKNAERLGELIAKNGYILVNGGMKGVMEASARGAKSANGFIIAITPGKSIGEANPISDIVITTGGTGIGPRDFTPEVAKNVIEKEIPGIMENIRIKYGRLVPNALLSRGIAGVMGKTQLYCLPGSLKAVKEYMSEILKTLEHLIYMLHGVDVHKKH